MVINEFKVSLNEQDLNRLVHHFVPTNNKVNNLGVAIRHEKIVIMGRANFILGVSFEAILDLAHTEKEIILRLERLSPMNSLVGQFKEKILSKIAERADFIQHDKLNDALRIDIKKALEKSIEESNLTIMELAVSSNVLCIALIGDVNL